MLLPQLSRLLAPLLIVLPVIASGDSWLPYEPERKVTDFEFGETTIRRVVDATRDQMFPSFSIDVVTAGKLVGRYGGISFEYIQATDDNKVFVAISNGGLPSTALIVFDADGNIRVLLDHRVDDYRFEYCDESVTLVKEWFDSSDPELTFVQDDLGDDVHIRSCGGEMLSLRELIRPTDSE